MISLFYIVRHWPYASQFNMVTVYYRQLYTLYMLHVKMVNISCLGCDKEPCYTVLVPGSLDVTQESNTPQYPVIGCTGLGGGSGYLQVHGCDVREVSASRFLVDWA